MRRVFLVFIVACIVAASLGLIGFHWTVPGPLLEPWCFEGAYARYEGEGFVLFVPATITVDIYVEEVKYPYATVVSKTIVLGNVTTRIYTVDLASKRYLNAEAEQIPLFILFKNSEPVLPAEYERSGVKIVTNFGL